MIIYGKNSIEGLFESQKNQVLKLYILKGLSFDNKIRKIVSLAKENGVIIQQVPREKLEILTEGANHQGIAASIAETSYTDFDDFIKACEHKEGYKLVLILDGVEDPNNLGSIIRTAAAAGVDGIILPKRRSAQVTGAVYKTSAGTVDKVNIIQVSNLANAIEELKNANFWVVSAEADSNTNYFDVDYNMNTALILGGENSSVSQILKKKSDYLVKIPMYNDINSLNVSNAASIVLYEIVRQKFVNFSKIANTI